jgi:hypothetical protein
VVIETENGLHLFGRRQRRLMELEFKSIELASAHDYWEQLEVFVEGDNCCSQQDCQSWRCKIALRLVPLESLLQATMSRGFDRKRFQEDLASYFNQSAALVKQYSDE